MRIVDELLRRSSLGHHLREDGAGHLHAGAPAVTAAKLAAMLAEDIA